MPIETLRDVGLRRLADLVHGQRVAMLTLRHTDGHLASRPMRPLRLDGHANCWMLAARSSLGSVAGGVQGSPGCLGYCDVDGAPYLSVSGPLQLDGSARRRAELWTAAARAWFAQGVDDPDLVCLGLRAQQVEVWGGPGNTGMRAGAVAASRAGTPPIGPGERA